MLPKSLPLNWKPIDQPLPINLATAMHLADARPLVIQAAQASEFTTYAQWERARVLWLPDVYLGSDYQRHDGGQERTTGDVAINDRNQFLTGGGLKAVFALTDAIYTPLAAKQLYRARNYDVQAAKNDALLSVTEAFFSVQQARGILAGDEDTVAKGRELVKRVQSLAQGLAVPIEIQRAETTLADLEQQAALSRQDWRINSANLSRVLRLNPAAITVPLEPPHLQVTVVPPEATVDQLIPEGLMGRPELASQQAVVKATIDRLKQERMRPLIPSLVLQGTSNPGDTLGGGLYEANATGHDVSWTGRSDWDFQVVWQLQNLGAGNHGLVHERQGENRQAMIELFRIQDQVAAEVAQAWAQVVAAGDTHQGSGIRAVDRPGVVRWQSERFERNDSRRRSTAIADSAAGSYGRAVAVAAGVQQLLHQHQRLQPRGIPAVSRAGLPGPAVDAKSRLGRSAAARLSAAGMCRVRCNCPADVQWQFNATRAVHDARWHCRAAGSFEEITPRQPA